MTKQTGTQETFFAALEEAASSVVGSNADGADLVAEALGVEEKAKSDKGAKYLAKAINFGMLYGGASGGSFAPVDYAAMEAKLVASMAIPPEFLASDAAQQKASKLIAVEVQKGTEELLKKLEQQLFDSPKQPLVWDSLAGQYTAPTTTLSGMQTAVEEALEHAGIEFTSVTVEELADYFKVRLTVCLAFEEACASKVVAHQLDQFLAHAKPAGVAVEVIVTHPAESMGQVGASAKPLTVEDLEASMKAILDAPLKPMEFHHADPGYLVVKSDIPDEKMQAFKKEWFATMNGPTGAQTPAFAKTSKTTDAWELARDVLESKGVDLTGILVVEHAVTDLSLTATVVVHEKTKVVKWPYSLLVAKGDEATAAMADDIVAAVMALLPASTEHTFAVEDGGVKLEFSGVPVLVHEMSEAEKAEFYAKFGKFVVGYVPPPAPTTCKDCGTVLEPGKKHGKNTCPKWKCVVCTKKFATMPEPQKKVFGSKPVCLECLAKHPHLKASVMIPSTTPAYYSDPDGKFD